MLYPSLHELKENEDSKYMIVIMAAKRARELQDHPEYAVFEDYKSKKTVGKALEEIAHSHVKRIN
ncbi:DNA-directed RNA polymerase subunit omega [Nosocomiicoccus ampullae]|uniref:DNA-directed RNA polymerase subunit omega n=1 Tax=Nosocomiicoccus ampullae TaxID=489910 RepID=A0A9Q2D0D9_9STAP|nr:DNA-directed RNA polymerase subunit omega [Nosocomiicoccus ampullae]MBB5176174.1 DNA-directed RNA polymerase subunit omega [Nosocomiicoccus ampullae]QYA47342.1 DNA-directed RNA polymerase subunit omega [Nosocomiicoccus ampullae]QYA48970.1 DNA-directed RNA polymerase subunit omega [Nosocomiicoccus ampullae]HJB78922.1 DNA-directed RNA polymerase subunit omega [Candidatus Nosocomiicoccus stercorigallinarum]